MQYQIIGTPLPVVQCDLQAGETIMTESGGMSWMSPNMKMDTKAGGLGKVFGRMISGESLFLNYYTAQGGPGMIAFASSLPGSIKAVQITPGAGIICQKTAFLACETGIELSVTFKRKIGAGLFGGEGFIMQRLSGQGLAFIEIDGHAVEYQLAAGQQMVIDTGYLAMMDESVTMDVVTVAGVKNVLLGGEGLFNTVVTGPGRIVLQTQPLIKLASIFMPGTK